MKKYAPLLFIILIMLAGGCYAAVDSYKNTETTKPQITMKQHTPSLSASPAQTETPAPTPAPKPTPKPTPTPQYIVTVKLSSAKLVHNNHVGNEWYAGLDIDGKEVQSGKSVKYTLSDSDSFDICCIAYENDKIRDDGSEYISVNVGSLTIGKNTFTQDVYVYENRGRYSGNSACWRFTIQITKEKKK